MTLTPNRILLTDRIAVVTGAGQGIGAATAIALAEFGVLSAYILKVLLRVYRMKILVFRMLSTLVTTVSAHTWMNISGKMV